MNHRRATLRRLDANVALVSIVGVLSYLGLASSCASTQEQPRDVPPVQTPPLINSAIAPIDTPLAAKAESAASPNPTSSPASEPTPITWRATQLDDRPASHLVTGKHRIASIVRRPDGARQLVVYQLPSSGNSSSPAQARASAILPAALQPATLDLELYMGRDDWPRVVLVPEQSTSAPKYFRYRPGKGWESPADEQGALASSGRASGYYGVLGHDDPELLCVPGVVCYEKRVSGWTKRSVPGPGRWKVVLTQALKQDNNELEVWAWPHNSEHSSLLQLGSAWTASVPAPIGPIHQMITWNGTYVALTEAGLSQLSPNQKAPSQGPEPPGAQTGLSSERGWQPLASITDGRALVPGAPSWLLVATKHGVFKWTVGDREPTPIHLSLPGALPVEVGNTCCISAKSEPSALHVIGGERGVFLVTNPDLD